MADFDRVPNRRGPGILNKWTYYPPEILPMWVADMDFPAPGPILKELHKVVDQGVLGYELPSMALKETVAARMQRLYGWRVGPDAVVTVTGIVNGFAAAARAFCTPRRGVLIQPPVYNEFLEIGRNAGIPQIEAPLLECGSGRFLEYQIDWEAFERGVRKTGMFLLCHPHNPLGKIFARADLARMAKLCIEHGVPIVSDEIHSELLLGESRFTPLAALSSEIARRTITLVSPSKTFNVPGLFCGFAIIPNRELRKRYAQEVNRSRLHVGSLGLHAARIAFSGECDRWLGDLRRYLTANREFLLAYMKEHLPEVRMTVPEATYLAWLDFGRAGIKGSPFEFFKQKAKLALSDGRIFGRQGRGHLRLNFGTSRAILARGLERMRRALRAR
jgi:cystathionine beta-lyase